MHPLRSLVVSLLASLWAAGFAQAAVQVEAAWARATMPGQSVAGVYMKLRASVDTRLVGAHSPLAGRAEVHEMRHEGGVMKMRKLDALELPAGRTVELRPGGLHVMLMELRQPLQPGQRVPLTLVFESGGKRAEVPVEAEVRSLLDEEHKTH
jgi:hypothetical protein